MRQLTRDDAERIAAAAAEQSLGISPPADGVEVKVTTAQVRRVANAAAFLALKAAGCLDKMQGDERRAMIRASDAATARHNEWKRRTGEAY